MGASDRRNSERLHRARDKGDRAGEKAKSALAWIAAAGIAVAAFLGQLIPWLTAALADTVGFLALSVSVIAVGLATTIRRSSDEPRERMAWLVGLVLLSAALVYYIW